MDVVVRYENAYVAVLELPYYLLDILDGNGVNSGKRLVQHYEFGLYGQASGNLRTASLTTGETVTQVLAYLLETELADEALQFLADSQADVP